MDGLPARPKARPRANATGVMRRRDNARRTTHLRLGAIRSPARRDPADPVMGRLAWIVLVLLSFGPPLGFALATVWR